MSAVPQFGFTILYVADMEAAKRFYVEVLGLKPERSSPNFVQFDHFALASDEPLSGIRQPEQYWLVEDADAVFHELSQKAKISLPLQKLPFGKVFAIQDPDGHPCFLIELSPNRPSQAVG